MTETGNVDIIILYTARMPIKPILIKTILTQAALPLSKLGNAWFREEKDIPLETARELFATRYAHITQVKC